MRRTELKRGAPLKRGTRMKQRSAKKRARDEVRARVLLDLLLERGNACEALVEDECRHVANDGHEILTRGRGGDPTDPANILLVCRQCHDWIHANPAAATERGLLRSAYA